MKRVEVPPAISHFFSLLDLFPLISSQSPTWDDNHQITTTKLLKQHITSFVDYHKNP